LILGTKFYTHVVQKIPRYDIFLENT